jgi:hypothetical protein
MTKLDIIDDDIRINPVLQDFYAYHEKTQEVLRQLHFPENLIQVHTMRFPSWEHLLPEEAIKIYHDIRLLTILYLRARKFSQRDIAKSLQGSSVASVNKELRLERERK